MTYYAVMCMDTVGEEEGGGGGTIRCASMEAC